ncbi:perforin-1-like [Genypterus blacodes]|uniref:perforin-1-like n=1 Tax=Genypterus blacodes TaxID=154954 RepID=UPI003F7702E2
MFLLNACVCVGFVLSLPPPTHQSCTVGTPGQCKSAEFAPGTNLAGEGFDITQMKRKGAYVIDMNLWKNKDNTCRMCANPFAEGKMQKIPLSVVDWRPNQACTMKVSSTLHRSSESLVSSSSSSVENNWKVDLNVDLVKRGGSLMLAGTHSNLAEYSMEKTKNDKFSFTSQSMICQFYSYRLSSSPKIHREFKKALSKLPKTYSPENKQRFYKLIDNFGTHYITKVNLGGSVKSVTSIKQCQASLQGLSVEDVQMCLEVEASATIGASSLKAEVKHCNKDMSKTESKLSFSSLFNDRFTEIKGGHTTEPELLFSADKDPSAYKDWLNSLSQSPDVVSNSLIALHELLPTNTPARKNLRSAISHYILEKALWRNCSNACQVGVKSKEGESCVCQCHNEPGVNADCCPTQKGMARVVIIVQWAKGLWGDHTTGTDGYVKVFFNGQVQRRTQVIYNNNDPHWGMTFDLGPQNLSAGKTVRFEVWDEDNKWDDDLLGECKRDLTAGVREDICALQHGQLYFKWEVTCAPSLRGVACMDYKPSPMSQSLKQAFTSRHSHPVPKAILVSMGVFVEEPNSPSNQSLTAENQKYDGM